MAVGIWCCAAGAQARTKSAPMEFTSDTVIAGDIVVPAGVTCIIRPGVTIKFRGYGRFFVSGLLIAEGTSENPIEITTYGRAKGAIGKPSWKGIEIIGRGSYGRFRHCRIEGAYRNLVWESSPVFDSCEFTGNHYALYCAKKSTAHIKNCSIYRNRYGIAADFSSPFILDNVITENTFGVYLQLSSRLIAGRNVISGNKTDVRSEECFGDNKDAMSSKYLWDLMRQLY